jgi:hypothetical protein
MSTTTTILFDDVDGATGDAVAAALVERIDRNRREFKALLDNIREYGEPCECEDRECTRDSYYSEEEEADAVGFAMDSLRLARVLVALRGAR